LIKAKVQLLKVLTGSVLRVLQAISDYHGSMKEIKRYCVANTTFDSIHEVLERLQRQACKLIDTIAYKLIKVKEDVKEGDAVPEVSKKSQKESAYDLIIQSDLLSGGIQSKYLNVFSADAQSQLSELIGII